VLISPPLALSPRFQQQQSEDEHDYYDGADPERTQDPPPRPVDFPDELERNENDSEKTDKPDTA
jgi:hypothetical protein